MNKVRIATTWLDGCSGCHMSFLDIDQRLVDIADQIEIVYSPLVDALAIPDDIDVAFIEGAVSSEDDARKVRLLRERSKLLIALGDCAVTGNVSAMRNAFGVEEVLERVYCAGATGENGVPTEDVPRLEPHASPVHSYVKVDAFLPGCPPPSDAILYMVTELLAGHVPDMLGKSRFGA
ncbi:NADP oxidoreductase [Desulfogranum marinum]|uniref:NADH-quinone oxidoreductase subunit B family protein n=1 Tax=Desulfogranum marinum TaxID=453220 RepID=UPI0029C6AADF|nr:NADP oxidoreductase [Desulfogranum marinum]